MNKKGSNRAKKLLDEIGFQEITKIPLEVVATGLGAILIELPMNNSDGRIISSHGKSIIRINSNIPYPEKRRFTMAHEIGHLLLHKNLQIHDETSRTLSWFNDAEKQFKIGIQEWEANDFAAELLMPEKPFREEVKGKPFSPQLISRLAERFKTSLTSTIFRCVELNIYPIVIFFISKGKVRFWRKSEGYWLKIKDLNKLPPPPDSVAQEYIDEGYDFIYKGDEKKQDIVKSVWFELTKDEEDRDMYEYCIPTKQYQTVLSVVWED